MKVNASLRWRDAALSGLVRICFSLARSSAGAERVFSILKNSFTINQMRSSLEDYTACSVMLQHNKKTNENTFVIDEEERELS